VLLLDECGAVYHFTIPWPGRKYGKKENLGHLCVVYKIHSEVTKLQWNSLKKNQVKKISGLRSQGEKAPKFSRLINITGPTLLKNFPLKK
jgi:hypothetical protein